MIYMRAARESYQKGEFSDIIWIRSAQNVADVLTKFEKSQPMIDFLECGLLTTQVEKWVIRKDVESLEDASEKGVYDDADNGEDAEVISQTFEKEDSGMCEKGLACSSCSGY